MDPAPPMPPSSDPAPARAVAPELDQPVYVIRRKVFKFLGGEFHISDGENRRIMLSRQKAFRLREDIRVWSAAQPEREMLSIQARNVVDFSAAYDVYDPQHGVKVGVLRRRGFKSIVRDEWEMLDAADRPLGTIKEDSTALALVRRFLTNLIPQTYHGYVGPQKVFRFRQHFNPFVLKMTLDFTAEQAGLLDRRLGLAAAILLVAIEGRQN